MSPLVPMPALATTMSSRPSCSTPLSTADFSASKSHTSTCAVTIRRSSALTMLCGLGEILGRRTRDRRVFYDGPQMSTAMMSAPSCANLTAWLRPWPRAAPVMNATLPSTRLGHQILLSLRQFTDAVAAQRISAPCRWRCGESRRPAAATRAISAGPRPARSKWSRTSVQRRHRAGPGLTRNTAATCSPSRASGAATTTASATAGIAEQHLLDLQRADVLAAADDDVGLAVGDGQVAVVIDHADVAGVIPAVVVERLRGQGRVGVAQTQIRSPAEYFAVIAQPDLDSRTRLAVGEQPLVLRRGAVRSGDRGVLGAAVGAGDDDARDRPADG